MAEHESTPFAMAYQTPLESMEKLEISVKLDKTEKWGHGIGRVLQLSQK